MFGIFISLNYQVSKKSRQKFEWQILANSREQIYKFPGKAPQDFSAIWEP